MRPPTTPLPGARYSVSAAFLVYAAVFGSWAPRIPDIKHALGLSDGQLGIALMGQAAGALAGTRLAGWSLGSIGSRRAIRVGIPLLSIALPALALVPGVVELTATLVLLGGLAPVLFASRPEPRPPAHRQPGRAA